MIRFELQIIYLLVYLTPNKCGLSALQYREIVNVTFNTWWLVPKETKQIFTSVYRDQLLLELLGDFFSLRKGPDKNDSNNGNEHVGMQKGC